MAKKKSKKVKMVESHEAQTIGFLQRSGVPAKDIKKLVHQIHELIEFGAVSIPEAHQEALENWHHGVAFAALKDLEKEHKKQAADVAKAEKRAVAAAKATTKPNEAAARLAAKTAKAEAKAAKTSPVIVPTAEPAGPTVMPLPRSPKPFAQESGIRKALGKSLTKEEQEYQKTLDKLRSDAANTVQENPDLFGSGRYDQTIDQSTLYQLYEGVVELGESAAKARKAEDKQRLLASLNAYKKIVMGLAKEGSDKEKELANKLLEIIASIEKKLSKGAGEIGRLKENLSDWMQRLPENLAAKIPLVGGFVSGMLQRKRERKEGEEYQKQDILAASSRGIGSSSLFGRVGGRGGMGGMSESAVEGISTGGSDFGDIESAETSSSATSRSSTETTSPILSGSLSGGETIRTLQSILVQVADIKSLIQGQTDSEAGLDAEEAARETADKEQDFFNKLKGLFGGGKGGKAGAAMEAAGGLGWKELIGSLIGKEVLMAAIAPVLGVLNSILGTIVSWPVIGGALGVTLLGGAWLYALNNLKEFIIGIKMLLDQYINKATGKTDPNPRGFMGAPRISQADIDATQSMKPDGTYTTSGSLPTNATSISESIDNEQLLKMIDEDAAASPENSPNFVGPPSPSTPAVSTGAATPAAMIAGAVMGGMNTVIPAASNQDDIDPDTGENLGPSVMSTTNIAPAAVAGTIQPKFIPNTTDYTDWDPKEAENDKKWQASPVGQASMRSIADQVESQNTNPAYVGNDPKIYAAQNAEIESAQTRGKTKREEAIEFGVKQTAKRKIREDTFRADPANANFPKNRDIDMPEPVQYSVNPNWTPEYTTKIGKAQEKYQEALDKINKAKIGHTSITDGMNERLNTAKNELMDISAQPELSATGTLLAPAISETPVGAATTQLDKSREGLEDAQFVGPMQPGTNNSNTVIAPKTNNTTINNNVGGASTRNNDPTLKAAERQSI